MARSIKKGPFIDARLEKKILAMNTGGKKTTIKTNVPFYSNFFGEEVMINNDFEVISPDGFVIEDLRNMSTLAISSLELDQDTK